MIFQFVFASFISLYPPDSIYTPAVQKTTEAAFVYFKVKSELDDLERNVSKIGHEVLRRHQHVSYAAGLLGTFGRSWVNKEFMIPAYRRNVFIFLKQNEVAVRLTFSFN